MIRKIRLLLRKLYWAISGRCVKCGVKKINWGYYSSGLGACPLCDMKVHESKAYQIFCPSMVENALEEYKRIWNTDMRERVENES